MIAVFDTETTDLTISLGADLKNQPYIVEITVMVFDKKGKLKKEFNSLVKPPAGVEITKQAQNVHKITNDMLLNAPSFLDIYEDLADTFLGVKVNVAANLSFDESLLQFELQRIDKLLHFPWAPIKFCTIEQSKHLKGRRLKNSELYKIATGKELVGAHRTKNDVLATWENAKWLVEQSNKSMKKFFKL